MRSLVLFTLLAGCVPADNADPSFDSASEDERRRRLCKPERCGPELGMPNYLCADGTTWAGPRGRCLHHKDGTCGWQVKSCPDTGAP